MRRRDFAIGLGASGIASFAPAQDREEGDAGQFPQFGRIYLQLTPDLGRRYIRGLVFMAGNGAGVRFRVDREFPFRNDDRIVIPGLTPPTALQEAEGARCLSPVYFNGMDLISRPPIEIRTAQTTVTVSDGGATFLIGGLTKLETTQTDGVPGLGSLPVVGALFRRESSTAGKTHLLLVVHATVVTEE